MTEPHHISKRATILLLAILAVVALALALGLSAANHSHDRVPITIYFVRTDPQHYHRATLFYVTNTSDRAVHLGRVHVQVRAAAGWNTLPPSVSDQALFPHLLAPRAYGSISAETPDEQPWRVSLNYGFQRTGPWLLLAKLSALTPWPAKLVIPAGYAVSDEVHQ